jgi:hypothetical protein
MKFFLVNFSYNKQGAKKGNILKWSKAFNKLRSISIMFVLQGIQIIFDIGR